MRVLWNYLIILERTLYQPVAVTPHTETAYSAQCDVTYHPISIYAEESQVHWIGDKICHEMGAIDCAEWRVYSIVELT